ncbi:MAG: hypothetical protein IH991_00930 [Planctomycetes bacterium]|nr:hypothetical protein [Planctomycetota bacterium]
MKKSPLRVETQKNMANQQLPACRPVQREALPTPFANEGLGVAADYWIESMPAAVELQTKACP